MTTRVELFIYWRVSFLGQPVAGIIPAEPMELAFEKMIQRNWITELSG